MLAELIAKPLEVGQAWAMNIQLGVAPQCKKLGAVGLELPRVEIFDVDSAVEYYAAAKTDKFGCLSVTISDEPGEGTEPVYYLPWGEHQAYKVRLASQRRPQPKLFFTANLNGCAVVAEGITLMPSVYHANAMNTLKDYSPVADSSIMEPIALKVIDQRNDVMFEACRSYPEDMSRSFLHSGIRWPLVKPAGAVTPREYAVLIGRPSQDQEKKAACTNRRLMGVGTAKFLSSRGAVFGVADEEGSWKLFVQKIVTLGDGKDAVLRCAEFWPGGFAARPW